MDRLTVNHVAHVKHVDLPLVAAHDLGRQVADLEKPVVINRTRDQVQVFAVSLQRGQVGLQEPLDADV